MVYQSPQNAKGVQFETVTVEESPVAAGGGPHSYSGSTEPLVTDSSNSSGSDRGNDQNSDGEVIQHNIRIHKREI